MLFYLVSHTQVRLCDLNTTTLMIRGARISFLVANSIRSQRLLSSSKVLNQADVPEKDGKKLTPQEAKIEAARLAMKSLKDMGSLFSSGNDEAVQPIDTSLIFELPQLFAELSLLHQGQVLEELQKKMDDKWTKLTEQDKKLAYYIYYGNWGPREKFENWSAVDAPLDLPFTVPSQIRLTSPGPKDLVKKPSPVILGETEVRKEQFDTSKMDPVTKTFIYLTIFIVMFALARDKSTGEKGKPVELVVEDLYTKRKEAAELARRAEEQAAITQRNQRHWYYLWLK